MNDVLKPNFHWELYDIDTYSTLIFAVCPICFMRDTQRLNSPVFRNKIWTIVEASIVHHDNISEVSLGMKTLFLCHIFTDRFSFNFISYSRSTCHQVC